MRKLLFVPVGLRNKPKFIINQTGNPAGTYLGGKGGDEKSLFRIVRHPFVTSPTSASAPEGAARA